MSGTNETSAYPESAPIHFCFLNPAWLPEWFWLPVAHAVSARGADYSIPPLQRDVPEVGVERNVDIIETSMQDRPSQYIVALSRGVEYAVRYLDRLQKKDQLQNIIGWTIISSAGPKGYNARLESQFGDIDRHTESHNAGVVLNKNGLEVLDPEVARSCMLHDVEDIGMRDRIVSNLTKARPLTPDEVKSVPFLGPDSPSPVWYIGRNDRVDNTEVSAGIARQIFHVEPVVTEWGHVAPLTHTEQVAETLLDDALRAQFRKDIS